MVLQLRKQIEQSLNKSGVSGYGAGMIYFIFYISKVYYKRLKIPENTLFPPRTIICSTSIIFQSIIQSGRRSSGFVVTEGKLEFLKEFLLKSHHRIEFSMIMTTK
jgi:hypothetical protein